MVIRFIFITVLVLRYLLYIALITLARMKTHRRLFTRRSFFFGFSQLLKKDGVLAFKTSLQTPTNTAGDMRRKSFSVKQN